MRHIAFYRGNSLQCATQGTAIGKGNTDVQDNERESSFSNLFHSIYFIWFSSFRQLLIS